MSKFFILVAEFVILTACTNKKPPETEAASVISHPNIVLITCEDILPYLSSYGDSTIYTKNLDRLALEGVKYTNMYAVSGVCAPNRSCLATGMYPTSIGSHNMRTLNTMVDGLPESYSVVPPPEVHHYAEYLRAAGYYTTNNSKEDYQFVEPVTVWDESSPNAHWKNRAPGQPFFAIFNSTVCHESQIWKKKDDPMLADPARVPVPPYYPQDNEIVRQDVARAYSNTLEMDQWAGEILAELENEGLLDSTVIVFFSDHGGPLPRQKREIYDSGLKVPFIVKYPDQKMAGSINQDLVSFVDIVPSVLSLANIPVPEYMQGRPFLGAQKVEKPRQYIYAARDRLDAEYDRVRGVRDHRYKYFRNYYLDQPYYMDIKYRLQMPMMQELLRLKEAGELNETQMLWFRESKPEEELYDCQNDPYELNNLAALPEYQDKLKELRQQLEWWQKEYGDLGAVEEKELVAEMWNQQDQPPATEPAQFELNEAKNEVTLYCSTDGASIGYKCGSELQKLDYQVYTGPFQVNKGDSLQILSHRIGYQPSEETAIKL